MPNPRPSRRRPFTGGLAASLAAALLIAATALPAQASEPRAGDDSLIERYSHAAQNLIAGGLALVGVNYRRGGTDPDSGLDCSGLVQFVFRESLGLDLPRTSREMSALGKRVGRKELKPGDLVFFNTMRRAFSHVGIYLGGDRFLHAPRSGGEVRVENMRARYWMARYDGARRIVAH